MTVSLLATAAALTAGLPIFALVEYLRESRGRRPSNRHASPTRKDTP